MEDSLLIRKAGFKDSEAICHIYNHYIENTVITFQETPMTSEAMEQQIAEVTETLPWLVAEEQGRILGYAYASRWKGRCAYRFSVETSLYVATEAKKRGIGSRLYEALLAELEHQAIHSVIAGIALPNAASVALHEKFGFEKVAHFKEVGRKFDQWIDVAYYQKNYPEGG